MSDFLTGVFNITPTPFHPDGSLDLASLTRLTAFTRETGVQGMTILGVLGEADKLTEGERDRVIETTIAAAGTGFPICVGTTHAGSAGFSSDFRSGCFADFASALRAAMKPARSPRYSSSIASSIPAMSR